MNSKEKLVRDIENAQDWKEYSLCIKKCENIVSIIDECEGDCPIRIFIESYGEIINEFGAELLTAPLKVRNDIVVLLNDEIEKQHDVFVTFKLCNTVKLLKGEAITLYDNTLCVMNILACVEAEKQNSYELFSGFAFLKEVNL